jgi:hypothetical protein
MEKRWSTIPARTYFDIQYGALYRHQDICLRCGHSMKRESLPQVRTLVEPNRWLPYTHLLPSSLFKPRIESMRNIMPLSTYPKLLPQHSIIIIHAPQNSSPNAALVTKSSLQLSAAHIRASSHVLDPNSSLVLTHSTKA